MLLTLPPTCFQTGEGFELADKEPIVLPPAVFSAFLDVPKGPCYGIVIRAAGGPSIWIIDPSENLGTVACAEIGRLFMAGSGSVARKPVDVMKYALTKTPVILGKIIGVLSLLAPPATVLQDALPAESP